MRSIHRAIALAVTALAALVAVAPASAPQPASASACTAPTDGRVALWRADGAAGDSAGSHTGTLTGTTAAYRAGVAGQAFSLPGDADYVMVTDAPDLDIVGDLTIDAWIQIDDTDFGGIDPHGIGGDRVIAWKVAADATFALWVEGDGKTAQAAPLGYMAGDRSKPGAVVHSDDLAWDKGTWYHVAITRTGDAIAFYRGGAAVGTSTADQTAIATPDQPLTLGAIPESGEVYNPLKGALDETEIWDRALSADEIKALHDIATGTCPTPPASPTPTPTTTEPTPTPTTTEPTPTPTTAPPPEPTTPTSTASPQPATDAPPDTTISSGPPEGDEIKDGSPPPVYRFASDDPDARFECRAYDVDSASDTDARRIFQPCSTPYTFALGLTDRPGVYRFEVRAIDAAGNADLTPATRALIRHADQTVPPVDRKPDRCKMISIGTVHGQRRTLLPGCRLVRIAHGTVPCMNAKTTKVRRCRFTRRSGAWVTKRSGRGPRYALTGAAISLKGRRRGDWIVATRRGGSNGVTVPCAKPEPRARKADTAGRVAAGTELSQLCLVEDNQQDYNAIGYSGWKPLYNWATSEVCSANTPETRPHPDLAELVRRLPDGGACYIGRGAGLNDLNGTERDAYGYYITDEEYCHMIVSGGYEVPGAKRPATQSYPYPGSVVTSSYIAWRPVNYSLEIANDVQYPADPYAEEPVTPSNY